MTYWMTCASRRWSGGDGVTNLNFLFAAYTAIWVLLFAYVRVLSQRHHALEKEIEELRELLQRRDQA
jgi:CcmD family protein